MIFEYRVEYKTKYSYLPNVLKKNKVGTLNKKKCTLIVLKIVLKIYNEISSLYVNIYICTILLYNIYILLYRARGCGCKSVLYIVLN